MKNFTSILTFGFVLAGFGLANADSGFVKSDQEFWTTHRTVSMMGDFTNNDLLDIFYGGQGNNLFDEPVNWWWQIQQNFCINQGDGTFKIDGYTYETYEYEDEETGETLTGYMPVGNNHGIKGSSFNQYAAIDYNNDGLLDLLLFGQSEWDIFLPEEERAITNYLHLYKNIGNGQFELETNAVFPTMLADNGGLVNYAIAIGDYDRDGYIDFAVSATGVESEDDKMPGRTVSLYRNINGTGEFKDMKIAETKGGVYTNEVKDEESGAVIVEKQLLEGYFLPMSGNVHFADINNDGWLDIVTDGWADNNWDGVHELGNTAKIYLNVNGEKFVDITSDSPLFYSLRSSSSSIADLDHDGYLDYFMTGWGDNGWDWNAFLFYNTTDENNVFEEALPCDQLGLDGIERCHQVIRDFDGDGYLDILYNGDSMDCFIYYGNLTGSFTKGEEEVTNNIYASAGDLTGNGLTDLFFTGYKYLREEETWGPASELYFNRASEVDSPDAPTNVKASVENGMLNVSWDYNTNDATSNGLAYNIYVKKADGSLFCLVPANPETGFVKVGYGRSVALRPDVTSYSMKVDGEVEEVGVQVISLDNETYSPFTRAGEADDDEGEDNPDTPEDPDDTGVESISAGAKDLKVNVSNDYITVEGTGNAVTVIDVTGRTVASGLTGEAIYVPGNGMYVVVSNGASRKIVK